MSHKMVEQTNGKYGIMNRACRYGGNLRGAWGGCGLGRQTVNGVVCGSTGSFEMHSEILSVRPQPFSSSSPSPPPSSPSSSSNVLSFSTYNFHLLRSWMQLVQFYMFSFFISFIISYSHLFFGLPSGRVNISFQLYFFFTILSSGIRCKCPNQLNLWAFMWFIIFLCLINASNSSFALILHVPSLSFVGPKIFLNTFLSNTINLFLYGPPTISF